MQEVTGEGLFAKSPSPDPSPKTPNLHRHPLVPGSAWHSMSSGLCPVYTQILPLMEAEPPHEAFPGGAWEREKKTRSTDETRESGATDLDCRSVPVLRSLQCEIGL